MPSETIQEFADEDGLINEFALMHSLRNSFPLHTILFKQCASHMCHEGNSEQLFSRAGHLSDNNGKAPPHRLAVWASISSNRQVYEPSVQQIREHYYKKFSKAGQLSDVEQYHVGLDVTDSVGNGLAVLGYSANLDDP